MTSLFCTLGTSWPVVAEAYLMGNGEAHYGRVLVLTTAGTEQPVADCKKWFAEHHPQVKFNILAVDGLEDMASAEDHHRFEEALFRCFSALKSKEGALHVCLAGGFKTMSSAAHQAAYLFGCEKLFHVTASDPRRYADHQAIISGIDTGEIRLIDLGGTSGWPTLLELLVDSPEIPDRSGRICVADCDLREKVYARLDSASHLMAGEKELATLPFPQIARWAPKQRHWLDQPLDPQRDANWVKGLPKIDLHCHLGGFATHGSLLARVRENAERPPSEWPSEPSRPAGWPVPPETMPLCDYMSLGDATGSTLLSDPGCLKAHCRLLYEHLGDQNVVYAEIRCSPNNYRRDSERSAWEVLELIRSTFQKLMSDRRRSGQPYCHVNLIVIATRRESGDRSDISRHLALAITAADQWRDPESCRVVGVDLAGFENPATRAALFQTDFEPIHRVGLAVTVHAGENDDAEGIWQAVFKLNPRRLGHALHLADAPDLLRAVADRRIAVELCPYANYQIRGYSPMVDRPSYPLHTYLEAGALVTVNTDNIGISAASISDNLLFLPQLNTGIPRMDILRLQRNAIDAAFIDQQERSLLLTRFSGALASPCHTP